MSACIVCGRSAGLLYSLHKQCYARYQEILESAPDRILEELRAASPHAVQTSLQNEFDTYTWQSRTRTDLIQRILERSAHQLLCRPAEDGGRSAKLIELFNLNQIDSESTDVHWILQRLENLPLVSQLLTKATLPSIDNAVADRFPFELEKDEYLIWLFPNVNRGFRRPKPLELPRSSLGKVFEMLTTKRHPQPLEIHSAGTGEIWLSNARMEYLSDQGRETVYLNDIMSITPVPNGVRIEQNVSDSVARDYICGDGLLMYTLLTRLMKDT